MKEDSPTLNRLMRWERKTTAFAQQGIEGLTMRQYLIGAWRMSYSLFDAESLHMKKLKLVAVQSYIYVVISSRRRKAIVGQYLALKRMSRNVFHEQIYSLDLKMIGLYVDIILIQLKPRIIVDLRFNCRIQSRLIFDPNTIWIRIKKNQILR